MNLAQAAQPSVSLALFFFAIYVLLAVGIGIQAARRESEEDFMIAERRVKGLLIIGTMTAGMFDGAVLSIYIAYVYQFGFSAMWFFLGLSFGFLFFRSVAGRIKARADAVKAYSMPEYFYQVFGRRCGIMFSIFLVTQFFGYLAVNFIISGKVLHSIFPALPYTVAVAVGAAIILTYLILAGFKAVVRTDLYQLVIMIVMVVTVGAYLYKGTAIRSEDLDLTRMGAGNAIGFFVLSSFGILVAPDLWQRVFAARDVRTVRYGFAYAASLLPALALVITVVGLATKHYFPNLKSEDALVAGFAYLLPYGFREFGLVLLYAVALSSSDTVTFVVSSIFTRDFQNYCSRYSEDSMRMLTRRFMIGFVVVAMVTAMLYSRILTLAFSLASLNLALFPVVFGTLFWKLRERAVFWSLVATLLGVAVLCAGRSLTPETATLSFPVALVSLVALHLLWRRAARQDEPRSRAPAESERT